MNHRARPQDTDPLRKGKAEAGDARRPHRRVNTLLRDRDAIRRMLEQAAYERLSRDVGRQRVAIDKLEALMSGEDV